MQGAKVSYKGALRTQQQIALVGATLRTGSYCAYGYAAVLVPRANGCRRIYGAARQHIKKPNAHSLGKLSIVTWFIHIIKTYATIVHASLLDSAKK